MIWDDFIKQEMEKDYFISLSKFLTKESKQYEIYPPKEDIFNAFKCCSINNIKCVLLGQDPYINPGEAHGLCFSVPKEISIPPSLKNIYKELQSDLGIEPPNHGCLIEVAKQGVLFLNSVMTVRKGSSGSHKNKGWEIFTDNVIKFINTLDKPIIYQLWGNYAKSKSALITNNRHYKIMLPHPSPFSAHTGFLGSKCFSRANEFLLSNNVEPINWKIK